jgi:hypothetical protein
LKTNNIENIVKDLLYEHTSRKMLNSLNQKNNIPSLFVKILAIAAMFTIAYFAFNITSSSSIDKNQIASNFYEFPTISKSRSGETHVIDDYITDLNSSNYKKVLGNLENKYLSEKDLFYKANIYFQLDSLNEAAKIIELSEWNDEYYQSEINWLYFLIRIKQGADKAELHKIITTLTISNQSKAKQIMSQIEH